MKDQLEIINAKFEKIIPKNELAVGDLIFFKNNNRPGLSHVGFYLYNNKFIHASSSRGVVIDDLSENLLVILVNKKSITNLDFNWTDSELVDYWNTFFSDYGFHIPDLIKHWEKLYHKDEFGESVNDNKEEIEFLKLGNFKPKTNRVEGMG